MSVKHEEVRGTVVNGVTAPTLDHLMSNKCTKAELQAALVHLIHIHNVNMNQMEYKKWADTVEGILRGKKDREWRATM